MLPKRSQRRKMAKQVGLLKKTKFKDWSEKLDRSIKAGQLIHQMNLQDAHNKQLRDNQQEEKSNNQ